MNVLSPAEWQVANEYCKGLADKEVADSLNKSVWTTKTQKRTIYRKLGISKDTELLLYMLCERMKVNFDLKEIRKHGLEILFSILFIVIQVTCHSIDMRKVNVRARAKTMARVGGRTRSGKREKELDFKTI
ncbi:LuxR C-terminal-related transcriptional regulator [uncultured Bacteroides sp.]|uniref:helix-turn-helix transcriptional regulator n=1 Tax=uncultured Bacteroides sp. TaxID=162156 RepID=UPI002AAB2084|nr:LuxR C-terminal-related transcriptional regulator [uncultured Bacteroides sp.]